MGEKVFLIDSNIFLEVLLKQANAKECLLLLDKLIEQGYKIALTSFTLYSIGIHLERHRLRFPFDQFLDDSQKYDFALVQIGFQEEKGILKISLDQTLDLDDAHQYWAVKQLNAVFVSFDRDFDKTGLKRFEPRQILQELG